MVFWLLISSLVVIWDFSFVLLRPRSLTGDISWIWEPYKLYVTIDKLYGDMEDSFVVGQAYMNIVETCINFSALFMHIRGDPSSVILALVGLSFTFSKTVLYFVLDLVCGFCQTNHNDAYHFYLYYFLPNSLWLIHTLAGVIVLGKKLISLQQPKQKAN
uniref:EXPERA domain-containing protein n=1 Tax=Arcella intermedia TaxID=1963864 RepID=A0A6B2LN91_9EUKA